MDANPHINELVLFAKLPEPGRVKTRLSHLKDGILIPEDASYLFNCMLFDVAEICMAAFDELEAAHPNESYRLSVSCAPPSNTPAMKALFEDAGEWPRKIIFRSDSGASFDEHYNDAFDQAWDAGANTILSMGADMPALTVEDVVRGFEALHAIDATGDPGIVISPDQEMGVSIVGWTRKTADTGFDHTGVFYNETGLTVLPAYVAKAKSAGIPLAYIASVPDVDTMADLLHNSTLVEALIYAAESSGHPGPWRTAGALEYLGLDEVRVNPNDLRDPRDGIDR